TAKVGNLIFISPFLSLVFIHFILGEKILGSTFVGLGLIVAGLFIQQFKGGK
ncbi:MAG: EamA/RhaT family transporter, partial [Pseudomonadota bacterium]